MDADKACLLQVLHRYGTSVVATAVLFALLSVFPVYVTNLVLGNVYINLTVNLKH